MGACDIYVLLCGYYKRMNRDEGAKEERRLDALISALSALILHLFPKNTKTGNWPLSPKPCFYYLSVVGAVGFEPTTSCSQGRRANQAALRPDCIEKGPIRKSDLNILASL